MNIGTFTWIPSYATKRQAVWRMRETVFTDGYSQRIRDGIFPDPRVFVVQFTPRRPDEANACYDFLTRTCGVDTFSWTPPPPWATRGEFMCEELDYSWDDWGSRTINATFREVNG